MSLNKRGMVSCPVERTSKKIKLSAEEQDEKRRLLQSILKREIQNEIDLRINDLETIEDRIFETRQYLEKVRQGVASEFYSQSYKGTLQLPPHPAVKDTFHGKRPVKEEKLSEDECISNYSMDIQSAEEGNSTPLAGESDNEGVTSTNQKQPRYIPPKFEEKNIIHLFEPRGNERKEKYRIIIGNVSKWIINQDDSQGATHKWTVYIKCKRENFDIANIISNVVFFLHPSYKPNDVVKVEYPPFKLTRRGWGEFPLRVQLHFVNEMDKSVDVIHQLKLDRIHSGLETFGGETVIDVWAHSKEDINISTVEKKENDMFYKKSIYTPSTSELLFSNDISKDILSDIFGEEDVDDEESIKTTMDEISNIDIKTEPEEVAIEDIDIKPLDLDMNVLIPENSESPNDNYPEIKDVNSSDEKNLNIGDIVNQTSNEIETEIIPDNEIKIENIDSEDTYMLSKSNVQSSGTCENNKIISDSKPDGTSNSNVKYEIFKDEDFNNVVESEVIISSEDVSYPEDVIQKDNLSALDRHENETFHFENTEVTEEIIYEDIDVIVQNDKPIVLESIPTDTRKSVISEVVNDTSTMKNDGINHKQNNSFVGDNIEEPPKLKLPMEVTPTAQPKTDKSELCLQIINNQVNDCNKNMKQSTSQANDCPNFSKSNVILKTIPLIRKKQFMLTTKPVIKVITQPTIKPQIIPKANSTNTQKFPAAGQPKVLYFDSVSSKSTNGSPLFKIIIDPATVLELPKTNGILKANSTSTNTPTKPNFRSDIKPIKLTKLNTISTKRPLTILSGGKTDQGKFIVQRKILPGVSLLKKSEIQAVVLKDEKVGEFPHSLKTVKIDVLKQCPRDKVEFAIQWLIKKCPLVDERAKKETFKNVHPYCAPNRDIFLNWPFAKQRAAEWMRARIVNNLLVKACPNMKPWTTVQILDWARLMAFTPRELFCGKETLSNQESITLNYTPPPDLTSLAIVKEEKSSSREECIDVVNLDNTNCSGSNNKTSNHSNSSCIQLPLEEEFQDLGKFLTNSCSKFLYKSFSKEEIEGNIILPTTLTVLTSAFQSVAEDLIRRSFAASMIRHNNEPPDVIIEDDVKNAILSRAEFDLFTNEGLGIEKDEIK